MDKTTDMDKTTNRELRMSRTFKASIDLMWEVWTQRDHLSQWWGPDGFTSTIHTMDFREGGEWKLTLHGPDGTNYPNRSVFKEIIPFKKIVFEHFNPHFLTTVTFSTAGDGTYVEWSMTFDSAEARDIVVKMHQADDGLRQNLQRLGDYLSKC
jgi:uncharacterized protein YndB with AHSA1/START domain